MKCFSPQAVRCGGRRWRAAFTLIELLTVMAIILILAGLVLSIAGHAQGKAAQSRAQAEIQALSTAAGNYQIDNGAYPRVTAATNSTKNTDTLDPRDGTNQVNYDPAYGSAPNYSTTSMILYECLSGEFYIDLTSTNSPNPPFTNWTSSSKDSNGNPIPQPTKYYTFTNSQLQESGSTIYSGYVQPTTVTAVIDPYGFSYGYSTIYQLDMDKINSGTSTNTTPTHGFNPTFDLWSTTGYSLSAGKSYPTITGMTSSTYNTLWVKNW